MRNTLLALTAFVMLGTACKKDDDVEITQESISGSYTIQSVTSKMGANPEVDITGSIQGCERDNVHTLASNGVYTVVDAGVTCFYNSELTSTWSLPGTNSIVIDDYPSVLESFDGSKLVFSATYQDPQYGTVTYRSTWARK
jgi:hypothetical protein